VSAVLKYSVLRLGLFVAALVVLSLLGASELTAVVGAALVSLLLSYVLLRRPREEMAQVIAERTERRLAQPRRGARPDADAAAEDAALDGQDRGRPS
jgi:positive regulator of sigma E activity